MRHSHWTPFFGNRLPVALAGVIGDSTEVVKQTGSTAGPGQVPRELKQRTPVPSLDLPGQAGIRNAVHEVVWAHLLIWESLRVERLNSSHGTADNSAAGRNCEAGSLATEQQTEPN